MRDTRSLFQTACLRNVSSAQGREKEITTQERWRKAKREGAFHFQQDDKLVFLLSPSLCPPPQLAGGSQHHSMPWILTTGMPQLCLILPTNLHKSLASTGKENRIGLSGIWQYSLAMHLHYSFSSTGLSDVPGSVWKEAHSNKQSAQRNCSPIATMTFLEKHF